MFHKTYASENTRRFKRLRIDYLIKYQVAGSEEGPFVSNAKDISASGLKFWTDRFLPERTLLKVSIMMAPLERTIEVLGRVLRVRRSKDGTVYYLAIGFLEIPKADQTALNEYIERLAKTPAARKLVDHARVVTREAEIQPV